MLNSTEITDLCFLVTLICAILSCKIANKLGQFPTCNNTQFRDAKGVLGNFITNFVDVDLFIVNKILLLIAKFIVSFFNVSRSFLLAFI